MSWPIRFEGLNQCDNLTNANLHGLYFDQDDFALFLCCLQSHKHYKLKLSNAFNISCVTETWLSVEIPPCVHDIDGYTCEWRVRVDRRGGCVLTYIHNSIPYYRLSILECDEVESLWLPVRDKCMPRNFHIFQSALYMTPCVLVTSVLLY